MGLLITTDARRLMVAIIVPQNPNIVLTFIPMISGCYMCIIAIDNYFETKL